MDYQKRIEEYRKIGREIKEEYIDEKRKDLLCIETSYEKSTIN